MKKIEVGWRGGQWTMVGAGEVGGGGESPSGERESREKEWRESGGRKGALLWLRAK
jgi:hypothetical protein